MLQCFDDVIAEADMQVCPVLQFVTVVHTVVDQGEDRERSRNLELATRIQPISMDERIRVKVAKIAINRRVATLQRQAARDFPSSPKVESGSGPIVGSLVKLGTYRIDDAEAAGGRRHALMHGLDSRLVGELNGGFHSPPKALARQILAEIDLMHPSKAAPHVRP